MLIDKPGDVEGAIREARKLKDEAAKKLRLDRNPSGRFGQPEESVSVGIYLASDESRFVNGTLMRVDGGMSCMTPFASLVQQLAAAPKPVQTPG